MNKNIIFVIGIMGNGGAERVISILSNELVLMGYNVSIITIYGGRTDYNISDKVKRVSIECNSKIRACRYIERLWKLRKIIKKNKSKVVVSFLADVNIFSIIACGFLGKKLIVSERNDPNSDPNNFFTRFLRNQLYNFCDGFVFQTEDARKYFKGKINKKGVVIPNPIKSNLPEKFSGIRRKEIVSVCRLTEQKNIKMSIDAFAEFVKEYPEYTYKIYGEGNLRKELEEYIKNKGLENKIVLPGFEKNIHDKIKDAKMLIISSNYEGISNVMLEAMAIGLPVISTDCPIGGAKMAIDDNIDGLLIPVGDTNALITSMRKLESDDSLYEKISSNATLVKEKFNNEKIIEMWIKYLKKVTGDL